jgi:hypothetical protein
MKYVEIKQISNGFLVKVLDPMLQQQLMAAQYCSPSSPESCFRTIEEVLAFVSKVYPTGNVPE